MSIARDLATFLTGVSYADIPSQAIDHAAMLISSTVASAALGSGIASSGIMRALAKERGGTPDASIWFDSGAKLPVAEAAQVNAVMSDSAASDDSDLRNIVHSGTTLVSTSLAIAERTGASGADILAAIVLGYEAAGRIGEAITPTFQTRGFHGCLVAMLGRYLAPGCLDIGTQLHGQCFGHDPAADFRAGFGELLDIINVESGQFLVDALVETVLIQKVAEGLRGRGEPPGYLYPEWGQVADHFAEGCVLAAYSADIAHSKAVQRDYSGTQFNLPKLMSLVLRA